MIRDAARFCAVPPPSFHRYKNSVASGPGAAGFAISPTSITTFAASIAYRGAWATAADGNSPRSGHHREHSLNRSGLDSMKFACIKAKYLRWMLRAAAQSLLSAAAS